MALTTPADKKYNPTKPGGINGGFYKRKSKEDHSSVGVETDSIDNTLKAIEKAGGKVVTPKHSLHHYAFHVSDDGFDTIFQRVQQARLAYGSHPWDAENRKLNDWNGGQGVYFRDLNGHLLELLTRP